MQSAPKGHYRMLSLMLHFLACLPKVEPAKGGQQGGVAGRATCVACSFSRQVAFVVL